MTFVKTRLLIESMEAGKTAEIFLCGEEPILNVPRSVRELGHEVRSVTPAGGEFPEGSVALVICKAAPR